jgi:hypothetical protein
MYTLPQGCSAKRQIILNEVTFVHDFYFHTLLKLFLPGTVIKNLTIRGAQTKGAAHYLKVQGATPMLKNNSAEGLLFWQHGIFH